MLTKVHFAMVLIGGMPDPSALKGDRLNPPFVFRPAFAQAGEFLWQHFVIERVRRAVIPGNSLISNDAVIERRSCASTVLPAFGKQVGCPVVGHWISIGMEQFGSEIAHKTLSENA